MKKEKKAEEELEKERRLEALREQVRLFFSSSSYISIRVKD
jgi:hypothetical protein